MIEKEILMNTDVFEGIVEEIRDAAENSVSC